MDSLSSIRSGTARWPGALLVCGALGYLYLIYIRKPFFFSPQLHDAQAILLDIGFRETLEYHLMIVSRAAVWLATLVGISMLLQASSRRRRPLWLGILGCILLRAAFWMVPVEHTEFLAYTYCGVAALQALAALALCFLREPDDSRLIPGLLAVASLYPLSFFAVPFYYVESVLITGLGAWVILTQVASRQTMLLGRGGTIALASAIGLGIGLWQAQGTTKTWYGYDAVFESIQFGRIDADEHPDLLTWGFRAQVAGNATVFPNQGRRFADWEGNISLHDVAAYSAYLFDFDGDGDMDLFTDQGLVENRNSEFILRLEWDEFDADLKAQLPPRGGRNPATWAIPYHALGNRTPESLFWNGDLNHDGWADVLLRGESVWSVWLSTGPFQYRVLAYEGDTPAPRTNANGQTVLVFLNNPKPINLNDHGIPTDSVQIKKQAMPRWFDQFEFIDLDADGKSELVLRRIFASGDKKATELWIYQESSPDAWKMAVNFKTGEYPENGYPGGIFLPPASCVFADFNRDGRLDFVGDDKRLYLQTANLSFKPGPRFKMPHKSREFWNDRMYAHDVDQDGWPDVISSYQPWRNIVFGPISN